MVAWVMNRLQEGSSNLYRIFTVHNLDFFIILSSLACIIGSHSQSNYPLTNVSFPRYLILLFTKLSRFLGVVVVGEDGRLREGSNRTQLGPGGGAA